MDPDETVTVPRHVYDDLIRDQQELQALNAHGVDNWEGYGLAMMDLYCEDEDE